MSTKGYIRREFLAGLSSAAAAAAIQSGSELHPKLYYSSATALAKAIRKKKISALEVANAYLKRIEEVNPKLNAIFQVSADRVQAAARAADASLARGQIKGLLHGVPMSIKDSLDTAGVISTAGTTGRAHFVPQRDATVVARLRAAGAILLGKTNTPEFTGGAEADNLVYGRTNNPYDLSISPAGSSGGEGAILAAGGSAFGIGSDTGGSVRLPAYFCGVTAIKPTNGRVPLTGHIVDFTGGINGGNNPVLGPMARYIEDLDLILPIIQGVDWRDPFVVPMPLSSFRTVDVAKLRVSFHRDNGMATPSEEVQRAVHAAASAVAAAGASVEEIRPKGIEEFAALWADPGRSNGGAGRARLLRASGTPETRPRVAASLVSSAQVDDFLSRENAYRGRMLSFMESYDVMICPIFHKVPQPHGWSHLPESMQNDFTYSAIFNILGWPAAVVRMSTSSSGLPIGVQIVARPWRDDVALAAAAVIENKLGGWKPPAM
jgi:amidase